jgi:uncharacterized protein YigA (DUF484 family)
LRRLFGVPLVEIRIWGQPPEDHDAELARFATAMHAPTCGADVELAPIPGLSPAWSGVRSAALIALRHPDGSGAFGLIALGSSDPERFQAGLGTAVLARIGELASAALAPRGSAETGRGRMPPAPGLS